MSRLTSLIKTEPALFTSAAQALLGVIAAFGVGFTADQTAGILAVTAAALAAVTAAVTRPVNPAAFSGLVTAAGVLIAAYGIHLNADLIGSINFLLSTVFAFLGTRAQVTPVAKLREQGAHAGTQAVPAAAEPGRM